MEDSTIPYGVIVKGDGSWFPKIVGTHPKQATSSGIWLPAGPCRVVFSWAGEHPVDLLLVNGNTVYRPASLAAKSGVAPRSAMVTIGTLAGDRVELNVQSAAGETGTIEVYPIPINPYPEGAV